MVDCGATSRAVFPREVMTMSEQVNPATDQPPTPPAKRHRLAKLLIIVLGLCFLGWELYALNRVAARVAMVNMLGWFGPSAAPLILTFSGDDADKVNAAVRDVLTEMGPDAVPALRESLTHADVR